VPVHEDDTPSLSVNATKTLFRCFGCEAGGGSIDWVMRVEGVSFRHAIELLRDGAVSESAPSSAASPVARSTVRKLAAPVSLMPHDRALLRQVFIVG
jgi:DNA primase